MSDLQEQLRSLDFTQGLDPAHLGWLAQSATLVKWDSGQTIFREGDRDERLYLILEGHVAIDISVPRRGQVRILTLGAGDVFGWSSVYYQKPKTATATAVEATRAVALNAQRLRELSDADARFGYWLARRLLEVLSERLKATRMQLLDVFQT